MKVLAAATIPFAGHSHLIPQVWMSAIEGFVPRDVVQCFHAYLDFCYIARMSVLTESTLDRLDGALNHFHVHRVVFQQLGIRDPTPSGLSLPRQHSMVHYRQHIENFGAPNGLCSSITESKHITTVKRPWRRSSRYNAIKQIVQVNQRMEKLTAARVNFVSQGILTFPTWQPRLLRPVPSDNDEDQSGAAHEDAIHNEVFLAQTHSACGTTLLSTLLTTLGQLQTTHAACMVLARRLVTRTSQTWFKSISSSELILTRIPTPNPPRYPIRPTPLMPNTSRSSTLLVPFSVHRLIHPRLLACTMRRSGQLRLGIEVKSQGHVTTASLFRTARTRSLT